MAELETQREQAPRADGGERDTALAFLSFARACALKKIDGLDEEQLRRRLVVSDTTLLGLVQHLTDGERYWFSHVVGGDPAYADLTFSMVVPDSRTVEDVVGAYRAAIADSDRALAGVALDDLTPVAFDEGRPKSVRWVVAHMTSEVARHVGHLDILREQIDEVTGR